MPRSLDQEAIRELYRLSSEHPYLKLIEIDTDPSGSGDIIDTDPSGSGDIYRITQWPDMGEEQNSRDYIDTFGPYVTEGIRYPKPGWTLDGGSGEDTGAPSGTPSAGTLYFQKDKLAETHDVTEDGAKDGNDGTFHVYNSSNTPFPVSDGWYEVNRGYWVVTHPDLKDTQVVSPSSSGDITGTIFIDDENETIEVRGWRSSTGSSWNQAASTSLLGPQFSHTGPIYQALPLQIGAVERDSDGGLPRVELKIDNASGLLTGPIDNNSGGRAPSGGTWEVTLKLVSLRHANRFVRGNRDSGDSYYEASPDIEEVYTVMETELTNEWVSMQLGAESILKMPFPPRSWDSTNYPGVPKGI